MQKNYFNLTNGIEALLDSSSTESNFGFVRIQSTWCERKEWMKILQDLDYDFLLNLALGNNIIVYDCGARKKYSRAIYQGVTWIEYALNKFWFGIDPDKILVKGKDSTEYFRHCYDRIFKFDSNKEKDALKKKLTYFKKFLNTDKIKLVGASKETDKDQCYEFYFSILKKKCT